MGLNPKENVDVTKRQEMLVAMVQICVCLMSKCHDVLCLSFRAIYLPLKHGAALATLASLVSLASPALPLGFDFGRRASF